MANRIINIDKIVIKRGNTSAISTYTGPMGELVMDTDTNVVYIQDGVSPGGHDLSTGSSAYGNTQVAAYLIAHPVTGTYSNVNLAAYLSGNITSGNITAHNITADNFFDANGVSLSSLITGVGTGYFTFHSNAAPAEVLSVSNANDIWIQGGGFHHASNTYPSLFLFLHGSDGEGTGGAEIDIKPDGLTLWSKYGEGVNPGIKWDLGQDGGLTFPDSTVQHTAWSKSLDANLGVVVSQTIPTLDANVGAYETWANTAIQTIDANVGAYETWANTSIQILDANVGAYETYANIFLGNLQANTNVIYNGTSNVLVGSTNGDVTVTTNGTNDWRFGTDGVLTLPTDGSIDTYSGTGGFKITTDGQIQFASGYSIGGSDTGLGLRMATDRGTILFGNHPECVPTLLTHFHIMKEDASAVDLFLGDDNNYVKLPGNGETAYGVEIGTNVGSAYTWRFGTDGTLTFPNNKIKQPQNTNLSIETQVVYNITTITNAGSGYGSQSGTLTSGGHGTGMTVNVNQSGTAVDLVIVNNPGTGYQNGDTITILGGSGTATFTIANYSSTPYDHISDWAFGADGNLTVPGSIIPSANLAYSLGDVDNWWSSLYVGGHTIYINGMPLSVGTGDILTFNNYQIAQFNTDGNLTVPGNLNVQGNTTTINSTEITINDNIINLHSPNDLVELTVDDFKDIGIKFHYYKGSDSHAFLGWANDTGYLEWYDAGTEIGNVFVGTSYGNIKAGGFIGDTAIINGVNISANLGTATTNITTLFSNAATQATSINSINANIGAYSTYANANAATQATSINSINANIDAYQTYANANAATQATSINSINANIGAYQTYANANAATQATSINSINANIGAYQTYANANASTQQTSINSINANLGAYQIYANANIGTITTSLQTLNANVGAYDIWANANAATQATSINSINANLGAYQTYANANIGTITTSLQTLNANIGAYDIWANANAATQATSIDTINANLGAYQTYANANASTQQTSINSINANLGAYQTYANTQLGLKATISSPTFTGTVTIPTLTVTGNTTSGNILTNNYLFANGVNILNSVTNTYGNVQVGANLRNLTTNITTTANVSAGNISVTNKSSLTTLTVTGTAAFNGLTQIQQLDLPYTAKTAATGTITHDCSVGQTFYHTSISANFTPNFTNLGLVSGYVTEVKLYLVQGSSSRSVTAMQIDGVAKTINWYNAVAPTYSSNAVDIITFEILLVNTTYTVFGKVEKYDSVAAGGGGG